MPGKFKGKLVTMLWVGCCLWTWLWSLLYLKKKFFSSINLISQGHSHWQPWFIRQSQCCWKQLVTHPLLHPHSHWQLDISKPCRSLWGFVSHCPHVPIHPPATFISLPLTAAISFGSLDIPLEFLRKTALYFSLREGKPYFLSLWTMQFLLTGLWRHLALASHLSMH